jgi:hypothetical protein
VSAERGRLGEGLWQGEGEKRGMIGRKRMHFLKKYYIRYFLLVTD